MLGFSTLTNNQANPVALFAATVSNAAGAGAGDSVTVTVGGAGSGLQDSYGNGRLPANGAYTVNASASQAATVVVSNKSTTGFTLTLTPVSSSATLAAGTVDIIVVG